MWKEVILAYAHFAAIFTLLWFLAKEWTILRMGADKLDTTALAKADAWFGIAAGLVLITGICRVTLGAKPSSFYLHQGRTVRAGRAALDLADDRLHPLAQSA